MINSIRRLKIAILVWMVLAGCTLVNREPFLDTTYADLTARLAAARQSQAAALALWDRVIFGEVVSCQDAIPVPEPVALSPGQLAAHPGADVIQARLDEAIKTLHDSSDLWNIECEDERPYVPLNMAGEGRAAALAATDPLNEVETLLAAWPQ